MNKSELKPAVVFEQFAKINEIPRPSKREEKMIEYLRNFGESRGLETKVDEVGNVIIRKGATPGYEDCKTVILQSHMDMVCDCLPEVQIDFDKEGITTYVDGEWMRAKGTTLGADDGIGIAIELAILDSNDIEHGPIECVFTRDEETGLTGAMGMKSGFMTGDFSSTSTLRTRERFSSAVPVAVPRQQHWTSNVSQLPRAISSSRVPSRVWLAVTQVMISTRSVPMV